MWLLLRIVIWITPYHFIPNVYNSFVVYISQFRFHLAPLSAGPNNMVASINFLLIIHIRRIIMNANSRNNNKSSYPSASRSVLCCWVEISFSRGLNRFRRNVYVRLRDVIINSSSISILLNKKKKIRRKWTVDLNHHRIITVHITGLLWVCADTRRYFPHDDARCCCVCVHWDSGR
jgi:hypothetical protein